VVPKGNPGDTQGGQGAHTQGLILTHARAGPLPPAPESTLVLHWFSIARPANPGLGLGWAWVGPGLGLGWAWVGLRAPARLQAGTPREHPKYILYSYLCMYARHL
jgi:hypothetical protein